jgi:hypothetical protein
LDKITEASKKINKDRKTTQLKSKSELDALQNEFFELTKKNLEIERISLNLREEVLFMFVDKVFFYLKVNALEKLVEVNEKDEKGNKKSRIDEKG